MMRAVAVLNGLHAIHHVLHGDFRWPLDSQSVAGLSALEPLGDQFLHKLPPIDLAKNGQYVLQKHFLNIRRLKFA
jgi:hypothetical protein